MGYTHYFAQTLPAHPVRWNKVVADVRKLLDNLPEHSESAGGYYADAPLEIDAIALCEDHIILNGKGPDAEKRALGLDLSHEDFFLSRTGDGRTFVKTNRKPYDLVVCATLIVVNDYLPGVFQIRSDGSTDDWMAAKDWASRVLGRPLFFPVNIKCPRRATA